MNTKSDFDPDELVLTKKEILSFCDRVIEKWEKNSIKNANNILAMNSVKASVFWTDDESLKAIWREILNWTFELLYENALAQGNNDESSWSDVLKRLKRKND
ncbi:MAG: hypothetical protein KC483_01870 [Nitrosarchaeum sp.]|nr:hypothetical protein [Nitrosarchaeum sp.]